MKSAAVLFRILEKYCTQKCFEMTHHSDGFDDNHKNFTYRYINLAYSQNLLIEIIYNMSCFNVIIYFLTWTLENLSKSPIMQSIVRGIRVFESLVN